MNQIPLFQVLMTVEARARASEVLGSGYIGQGPLVDQFEAMLAEEFGVPPWALITVNSGTSALHLAYHLLDFAPGDAVIATPMTCAATIAPLMHLGARIIWADVDRITGNIDPASVADKIDELHTQDESPAAIVAVDWAGTPIEGIEADCPIVEDAAHAMFARRRDGSTVAFGSSFTCFSFQAIKHLTTIDGGLLVCPSLNVAERARKLRWFGLDRRSKADFRCEQDILEAGYKFHMHDVSAAIGIANLPIAREAVESHRANAARYHEAFVGLEPRVITPPWRPSSSWWIYTLIVNNRPSFQNFLAQRGITTSQVHRRNDHHTAFIHRAGRTRPGDLPGLDFFSEHQCSIPVGWWLTSSDVDRIIDAVRTWARS